jgi:hypothetical protein
MPNGRYFDRSDSLKFPLYPIPPIRVIYRGFVDEIGNLSENDELWKSVDPGLFAGQMIKPEQQPEIPSRYELLQGETEA